MSQRISLALLAALTVFALPSLYAEPQIQNCSLQEEKRLAETIVTAKGLAQQCLIDDHLNPALGQKLLDLTETDKVTLHCADSSGLSYGASTKLSDGGDGSANVALITWPPPETLWPGWDIDYFKLFHELIHVTDPSNILIVSQFSHNQGYVPDVVHGCTVACMGYLTMDTSYFLQRLRSYELVLGREIPRLRDWPCDGQDPDTCMVIQKFAWVCRQGKSLVGKDFKRDWVDSGFARPDILGFANCLQDEVLTLQCSEDAKCLAYKQNILGDTELPFDIAKRFYAQKVQEENIPADATLKSLMDFLTKKKILTVCHQRVTPPFKIEFRPSGK